MVFPGFLGTQAKVTGNTRFVVTLGDFTKRARVFAHSKSNLRLIDGADLVEC